MVGLFLLLTNNDKRMRDSMIFYRSFYEAIRNLSTEDQCQIYNAIFSYGLDFKEPELSGIPASFWQLIRPQIDANIKRFENGKRPKLKQNESKSEAKNKQNESKSGTNNNVNVNVNDNSTSDEFEFDLFWNAYDKKVDRSKCLKAYLKLPKQIRGIVYDKATSYRLATPEVRFRKNPLTWINGKCWEDETPKDGKKEIHAFHNQIFD
jgi:hypothetical protein